MNLKIGMRFKTVRKGYRSYTSITKITDINNSNNYISLKVIKKGKYSTNDLFKGEVLKMSKNIVENRNYYKPLDNKIRKL